MVQPTQSVVRRFLPRRAAALCLALSVLTGCSVLPNEEEPLDPPKLTSKTEEHETSPVTRGNMELYLTSTASAVSDVNNSVSFPESGGILKKFYVAEGDTIKAGAPIAELETGDLPIRVKLQKLTVEQSKLRYQDAIQQNAGEDGVRLAKIDLEAQQLQLDSLQEAYNKALLFAPSSGLVTYLNDLKPGEPVEANQAIAIVSDPSKVNFVYDATDATKIKTVKDGTEVAITLDDDKSYEGSVIQTPSTAPKSDKDEVNRRNAKALIIALNPPSPAVPIGTYADIKLFIDKRDNVILIPRGALKTMFGRNYVEVMENDRVKEVDVVTGLKTSDKVEIVKGLEEGQKVVID
ncbi:efflux RND transporter periplasmic adaptor subunit [Paenibacillus sacheonensis]|uniref:HlyD family efflux transporter periplasmic adaptor subunit n=1 Tax=Paenibacillus sacheonensis TaxID=742054 RepID=A0A7X5C009_9BACL|nr:HlyD family efflux transporter periplasmic adaptor subunit [Paenibacillus sacheonensis]MBM7565926.1 RND family efflux transporter MFP subunit [Paenibacillus sacheonensis]NBC68760.1 HlyD family efflux transporter periplasmic adaptor subunit [Paenibacillus sacheonensis]